MVAGRKDDAAPPGLKFILIWVSTNMPRRTALETAAANQFGMDEQGNLNHIFMYQLVIS